MTFILLFDITEILEDFVIISHMGFFTCSNFQPSDIVETI